MPEERRIEHELSFSELFSQTFDSFRQNYMKYFLVYLAVEVIIGILATLAVRAIRVPSLSLDETFSGLVSYFRAYAALEVVTLVVGWIIGSMATGVAIRVTSNGLQGKQEDIMESARFVASKLIVLWVLELIVGVLVTLGLIALIVPGIILDIMFYVAAPVLLIEGIGVFASMTRSRQLVAGRWLKTFAFIIVLAIIVGIIGLVGSAIGSAFGAASTLVTDIIKALYVPLTPIGITVFYYSNVSRLAPPSAAQPVTTLMQPAFPAGSKYCPSCGAQLSSGAEFCSKCGAKQPV